MLGLWSFGSMPMGLNLHIAFEVTLDNLLEAPNRLKSNGITSLSFFGEETSEPSVIGWMRGRRCAFRICSQLGFELWLVKCFFKMLSSMITLKWWQFLFEHTEYVILNHRNNR
jgi:hypothetical protein